MNVNHKENFKDPITFVHTNKIEGNWNALNVLRTERANCGYE